MNRWAMILGCALCLLGLGCAGDDSDGSGGNAGSGAGAGGVGASGGVGGANAGHGGTLATGGSSGTGGGSATGGTGSTAGAGGVGTGTGGSGGASGASGTGGSTGEAGGSVGASCGGRGQGECDGTSYCDYPPEADCGRFDAPGTCAAVYFNLCDEDYVPVCGCDGVTYTNSCTAQHARMSIDHDGECDAEPTGGHKCVPTGGVACLIAPTECLEGEVPSYDDNACGGPCVPIETCDCSGPEDCPFADMYACHMSAGHCGPYVN